MLHVPSSPIRTPDTAPTIDAPILGRPDDRQRAQPRDGLLPPQHVLLQGPGQPDRAPVRCGSSTSPSVSADSSATTRPPAGSTSRPGSRSQRLVPDPATDPAFQNDLQGPLAVAARGLLSDSRAQDPRSTRSATPLTTRGPAQLPTVAQPEHPTVRPFFTATAPTWPGQIQVMRAWMLRRAAWLDCTAGLGGGTTPPPRPPRHRPPHRRPPRHRRHPAGCTATYADDRANGPAASRPRYGSPPARPAITAGPSPGPSRVARGSVRPGTLLPSRTGRR